MNEKTPCVHGSENSIVSMSAPARAIRGFRAILLKIPMTFFADIENSILKFLYILKESQVAKTILKKKKFGGFTFP